MKLRNKNWKPKIDFHSAKLRDFPSRRNFVEGKKSGVGRSENEKLFVAFTRIADEDFRLKSLAGEVTWKLICRRPRSAANRFSLKEIFRDSNRENLMSLTRHIDRGW